jgi:hypothetical protein
VNTAVVIALPGTSKHVETNHPEAVAQSLTVSPRALARTLPSLLKASLLTGVPDGSVRARRR